MALRIRKDDKVMVTTGRYKGTVSKVLSVAADKGRAYVENVNMRKHHVKAQGPQKPGGIIEREGPIHLSNLLLFCEKCKTGRRFRVEVSDDGKKKRLCKKCGSQL